MRKEIIGISPESILDAGCGEGIGLLNFQSLEIKQFFGVDIHSDVALKAAANCVSAQIAVGDVLALPFPDQAFDTVTCLEVLEHLPYPSQALKELIRVSKRCVLVSVPHEPFFRLGNFLTFRNFWRIGNDPEHILEFSGKSS